MLNESLHDNSPLPHPCNGCHGYLGMENTNTPHRPESSIRDRAQAESIMVGADDFDEHDGTPPAADHDALQEGMLPRDVPQRTTFYDPVAERHMTQTDAKLFYQRSKIDGRGAPGAAWATSPPQSSHIMPPGSRSATEYGADSLILDNEAGKLVTLPAQFCFSAPRPMRLT